MKRFSLSELNRRPGELVDEALEAPVTLTKRGRPHVVMLSAKRYAELVGKDGSPLKAAPDFSKLQVSTPE